MAKGLRCPECGHRTLLSVARVMVTPMDVPGQVGRVYGRPVVLAVPGSAQVVCNRSACDFESTMKEVQQRKAGDSNTKV